MNAKESNLRLQAALATVWTIYRNAETLTHLRRRLHNEIVAIEGRRFSPMFKLDIDGQTIYSASRTALVERAVRQYVAVRNSAETDITNANFQAQLRNV